MDERSERTSSACDPFVDVSDVYRSRPAPCSPQHGLAPSPTRPASRTPSPSLPEIPAADLDLTRSFEVIMGAGSAPSEPHAERVQKRASNVLKLTQENEKLKEQLREMTARLEAVERRREEIANRELQQSQQQPDTPLAVADTHPARSECRSS